MYWKNNKLHKLKSYAGRKLMGTITGISTDKKVAALTFDDGPEPEYTPVLLEILRQYNAKATFFVVGSSAEKYPELLEKLYSDGHAIGNHSFSHIPFPNAARRERMKQLKNCQKLISKYQNIKLFRPPFGLQNHFSRIELFLLGYKVITWSIAAEDWLDHSDKDMAENVIRQIFPGSIILFHDSLYTAFEMKYADRTSSFNALKIVLHKLSGLYKFVTIPELLKLGSPRKENWYYQPDPQWFANLKTVRQM